LEIEKSAAASSRQGKAYGPSAAACMMRPGKTVKAPAITSPPKEQTEHRPSVAGDFAASCMLDGERQGHQREN